MFCREGDNKKQAKCWSYYEKRPSIFPCTCLPT